MWLLSRNRFIVGFALFMAFGNALIQTRDTAGSFAFKMFFALCWGLGVFAIMVVFNLIFQLLFLAVRNNRGVAGSHEYQIRENGLFERTDVNESIYRWEGFHKISRSKKYLFVYVTDNNVHYIPLSSFSSLDQERRFVMEIESRWKR
jgi:hypothetical protein